MAAGNSTLPPGGLMEIVFSFDTTGSMSSVLEEVQGRLQDMIQRLQADIPGIRIGVIAHGDYCDKDVFYLTKELDLCTDVVDLCNFVKGVDGTGGGDADECYELILRMVRQNFSWTPASQKILVMIGDANPHEPEYDMNVDNIDWREEINCLHNDGVKIYGVQAFDHEGVEDFYKTISANTEGHYLKLGEFSNICDFLMAICYRERGEDLFFEYEAEVRSRFGQKGINRELEGLFGTLRRYESGASNISTASSKHTPAPSTSTGSTSPKIKKTKVPTSAAKQKRKPNRIPNRQIVKQNKKSVKSRGDQKAIHREKVTHSSFTCSRLDWSKWRLAYTPLNGTGLSSKRGFITKFRGNCLKRKELFSGRSRKMALYEVAVQTKIRGKRHVLYSRIVSGNTNNVDWESALLHGGKKRLLGQIQSVIDSGCKVFVRRALVTKRHQSRLNSLDKYNYAWSPQKSSRKHRRVVRDTVVISGDRDID
ncbi:Ariadne-like RING finger protein R811 [Mizuhopecten yessoensis]|uniref:Ariadne-like RING finger protein R811 n=1 Tax=Mizuhopecten yessoensis TaxID=6573 RepID=A0A210QTI2_MIZYE|nr:Ariadne-like RING finger protein R811 [Mizuhopecten yessoensis]